MEMLKYLLRGPRMMRLLFTCFVVLVLCIAVIFAVSIASSPRAN